MTTTTDLNISKPTPITVAIDWDGTFTALPAEFLQFIKTLMACGNKVYIVTMRYPSEVKEMEFIREHVTDIIFTSREAKRETTEKLGIKVDIWIDDKPESVTMSAMDLWGTVTPEGVVFSPVPGNPLNELLFPKEAFKLTTGFDKVLSVPWLSGGGSTDGVNVFTHCYLNTEFKRTVHDERSTHPELFSGSLFIKTGVYNELSKYSDKVSEYEIAINSKILVRSTLQGMGTLRAAKNTTISKAIEAFKTFDECCNIFNQVAESFANLFELNSSDFKWDLVTCFITTNRNFRTLEVNCFAKAGEHQGTLIELTFSENRSLTLR